MSSTPRRQVGAIALACTGLGSIIGSGWLFGAARASHLAGPGAILTWIIGAAVVIVIALSYSELGTMFPESGGMVRYSHYSHGQLVGFLAGWANWLSVVAVIPVEAEASVQYMHNWPWQWASNLSVQGAQGSVVLTTAGLWVAAALVLVYFLINYWSVQLFARSNLAITIFKLALPVLTGVLLICSGFHSSNLSVPNESHSIIDFPSILTAISTAGIIFSFNGFQSPINLAGEARNPSRNIPIAVVGSILVAAIIYVLLQVAYLGTVPTEMLARLGWHGINFHSPFADLAILLGLQSFAILLFIDSVISPSGTAITYTATTARMLYGMAHNGTLPKILGNIHPKWGIPRPAMWFNLLVIYLFLFFFRGWDSLAAVIGVATVISYLTGPVSAMSLRLTAPKLSRPLRIKGLPIIAALAFVLATELLYWATWPLTGEIILLMIIGLPVYLYYQARAGWADIQTHLASAWWLILYFPIIALLSWAGSTQFKGHNYLSYGWDMLVVAIVALIFFVWGIKSGRLSATVKAMQDREETFGTK